MRMKSWILIAALALSTTTALAQGEPEKKLQQDEVLGYLEQLVQWQRDA